MIAGVINALTSLFVSLVAADLIGHHRLMMVRLLMEAVEWVQRLFGGRGRLLQWTDGARWRQFLLRRQRRRLWRRLSSLFRGGGCGCGGRAVSVVYDGGGQVTESVVGGQHVGIMMVRGRCGRRRQTVVVLCMVLVSRDGLQCGQVLGQQRLVPAALAPVTGYGHVQLVHRTELVHFRFVRVQVLDVSVG